MKMSNFYGSRKFSNKTIESCIFTIHLCGTWHKSNDGQKSSPYGPGWLPKEKFNYVLEIDNEVSLNMISLPAMFRGDDQI